MWSLEALYQISPCAVLKETFPVWPEGRPFDLWGKKIAYTPEPCAFSSSELIVEGFVWNISLAGQSCCIILYKLELGWPHRNAPSFGNILGHCKCDECLSPPIFVLQVGMHKSYVGYRCSDHYVSVCLTNFWYLTDEIVSPEDKNTITNETFPCYRLASWTNPAPQNSLS